MARIALNIYFNNLRTFSKHNTYPMHHDLMLANGYMAAYYDDQEFVDRPTVGDTVALYAKEVGIVAFGLATNVTTYLDDGRVGRNPTKFGNSRMTRTVKGHRL